MECKKLNKMFEKRKISILKILTVAEKLFLKHNEKHTHKAGDNLLDCQDGEN